MSFFKKLGGAITKGVSFVTGVASKILPGPLGGIAGGISKVSGAISTKLTGATKSAQAAVFPSAGQGTVNAAQAAAVGGSVTLGGSASLDKKPFPVWGWIAIGVGVFLAILGLFTNVFKSRRR